MQEKIITEDEYRAALLRFLYLCDTIDAAVKEEELKQLVGLMEVYENENEKN